MATHYLCQNLPDMKKLLTIVFASMVLTGTAAAQGLKTPAPSPSTTVRQEFALSNIELNYSRPAMRQRAIFGELVPFDKVWRTGANSATTLQFGEEVNIGGTVIKPGKYGLLSIPGANNWTIIISKQLDVTSPAAYKQDQDVVRFTAPVGTLPFSVETFTIMFGNVQANSCELWIMWDKTFVSFPIVADVDSKVMKQIDQVMNVDSRPYFNAAVYYVDNNKDLNKALEWFNKAVAQQPEAFWVLYQKARCEAKLGKKADAIATAQKSIAIAKAAKNDDYVKLNEDLIKSLK